MAATGIAMAAANFGALGGAEADEDDLDETLADHVQCWFAQFEQRPWWQTLSSAAHSSCMMEAAKEAARTADYQLSHAARRNVFESEVRKQTEQALGLYV